MGFSIVFFFLYSFLLAYISILRSVPFLQHCGMFLWHVSMGNFIFTQDFTWCVAESKCYFVVDLVVLLVLLVPLVLLRTLCQKHCYVILYIYYTIYKVFLVFSVEFLEFCFILSKTVYF